MHPHHWIDITTIHILHYHDEVVSQNDSPVFKLNTDWITLEDCAIIETFEYYLLFWTDLDEDLETFERDEVWWQLGKFEFGSIRDDDFKKLEFGRVDDVGIVEIVYIVFKK